MTGAGSLEALAPTPRKVPFRGGEVEVAPLRLSQISGFAAATRQIAGRMIMAAQLLEEGQSLHVGAVLYEVLEQDVGSLAEALAIATGLPADEIADAQLPEVVDLVEAVVEVNHDFFFRRLPTTLQRLRPLIPQLVPKVQAAPPSASSPSDGSTSPSTSSSTGTGSETS